MSDPLRNTGSAAATVGAAVAGAVAAPTIAAAAGATSIPVVTTVASWVGLTAVAATPVGWFLGCGLALGGLGYFITKLVGDGGEADGAREAHLRHIAEKREAAGQQARQAGLSQDSINRLQIEIAAGIKNGRISLDHAKRLESCVRNGTMTIAEAQTLCAGH